MAGEEGALTDKQKASITALVEEYKSKVLQIIALDAEVSRWSASYVVALVVGVGWVITNQEKNKGITGFLVTEAGINWGNCLLLLFLSSINCLYILWLAIKGVQTQQLYFYLHVVVGRQVSELTNVCFNKFETWRRSPVFSKRRPGGLDWRRTVYYAAMPLIAIPVSFACLFLYFSLILRYQTLDRPRLQNLDVIFTNLFFAFVIGLHVVVFVVSISTPLFGRKWRKTALADFQDKSPSGLAEFVTEPQRHEPPPTGDAKQEMEESK